MYILYSKIKLYTLENVLTKNYDVVTQFKCHADFKQNKRNIYIIITVQEAFLCMYMIGCPGSLTAIIERFSEGFTKSTFIMQRCQ